MDDYKFSKEQVLAFIDAMEAMVETIPDDATTAEGAAKAIEMMDKKIRFRNRRFL